MKTIYVDSEFHCYLDDDGTRMAVETDFFDGKCDTFIKGYRFVPQGEAWIRKDGAIMYGEMIAPWKDITLLNEIQSLYEEAMIDKERLSAVEEQNAMLTECILEMSELLYA